MIIELKGGTEVLDIVTKEILDKPIVLNALDEFKLLIKTLNDFGINKFAKNSKYVPELGAQKQICGGGTYNLIENFGGERVESTGFAFGFDRLMGALMYQNKDFNISSAADIFIAPINQNTRSKSFQIAQELRKKGISTEVDLSRRKFKKILNYANHLKVKYVILVGERDLEENNVTVKNMESGNQEIISIDNLTEYICKLL